MYTLVNNHLLLDLVLERQAERQRDAELYRLLAEQQQAEGTLFEPLTALVARLANVAERLKLRQQATI